MKQITGEARRPQPSHRSWTRATDKKMNTGAEMEIYSRE